jgi:hypothetical protein
VEGDKVWRALKYTGKQEELTVKALQKCEVGLATSWNKKSKFKKEVGFPKPLPGMKMKAKDEGGETYLEITEEEVKEAIRTQSIRNVPGPDKIDFKIIRLLWEYYT